MKRTVSALIFASILLIAAITAAAPSHNGSTGLVNIPSADVLHTGQFSLGYYDREGDATGSFGVNLFQRLEVSAGHFRPDTGDTTTIANAKFALLQETLVTPAVAVGVEDLADKNARSAYIVASKQLPFGFRVHYGLGNGRFDGVFGGIEKTINPAMVTGNDTFPATTLMAEYDGQNTNVGLRLAVVPGVKVDAGWEDLKDFYFGASVTF